MAIVRIHGEGKTLTDEAEISSHLAGINVSYERWEPSHALADDAPPEEILAAYGVEVERLKSRGGYVTADVIDLGPDTPGLDQMLDRFNVEHWHDEDEVRLIVDGRGLFHFNSERGRVRALEVERGDFIRVPSGTWHWFDLCDERRIRAIRLFQDPSGWTPHYTGSGADRGFQPLCMGPSYVPVTGAPAV